MSDSRLKLNLKLDSRWTLWSVVVFFAVLMTARTISKGWDFEVFWRVSRDFWSLGTSPYDLSRYGNMVFKYPPWILPFFLPFGWLPLAVAKGMWGIVQGVSLAAVVRHTDRLTGNDLSRKVQVFVLVAFFGIWSVHGIVGQTSLPMLALALGFRPDGYRSAIRGFFALSAKVLTVFAFLPFLGLRGEMRKKFWVNLGIFILLAIAASIPVWVHAYGGNAEGISRLLTEWWQSNFSGTAAVDTIRIGFTTREAQGVPSLLLRFLPLDEGRSSHVLLAVAASMVAVGAFGFRMLKNTSDEVRWLGWLALTPTVQPLAWFHFYTFAYPLLVWAWLRALDERSRWKLSLLTGATLLIAVITQKTAGPLGHALEMLSEKSLGVLLLVAVTAKLAAQEATGSLRTGAPAPHR